jgi:hypothetical protein
LALTLIGGAIAAKAQERLRPADACYERIYDRAHLARNPRQQTLSIFVSIRKASPDSTELRLHARRSGFSGPLMALGGCTAGAAANRSGDGKPIVPTLPSASSATCIMVRENRDSEGGHAGYEVLDGGRRLRLHVAEDLVLERINWPKGERSALFSFGGADGVFLLARADRSRCADMFKALPN